MAFKDGEEALKEICRRVDEFLDEIEAKPGHVTRQELKNLLVACIGTKIVRPEDWLGGKILQWRPSPKRT